MGRDQALLGSQGLSQRNGKVQWARGKEAMSTKLRKAAGKLPIGGDT